MRREDRFDAVLLDASLTNVAVAGLLRALGVPIVALRSIGADTAEPAEGEAVEASLRKPIKQGALLDAIASVTGAARAARSSAA